MNDLENLLNRQQLDILNKRSVIQYDVIDIPKNKPKQQNPSTQMKAKGNAQLIDFISIIGLIIESLYEDSDTKVTYMPRAKAYFSREDADQRFKNPIITYRIMDRKIKDKTSKNPQLKESLFEKDDNRTGNVYSMSYESVVRFQFLALEYNVAYKLMTEFEEMMFEYKSYLKEKGIVNYYFLRQQPDDYNIDFRDVVNELTIDYHVETQKNTVIFKENDKTLIINGEAVDEQFNPIPTNPKYLNK